MDHFWKGFGSGSETSNRFESHIRSLPRLSPDPDLTFRLIGPTEAAQTEAFLTDHFSSKRQIGSDSMSVILYPTLRPSDAELVLIATDRSDQIVGSIRYRYSGEFEGQPLNCIDCFCVHPAYRKSGLASKLLMEIHELSNRMGKRYSVFLKEGRPVPSVMPFYSSAYVYKQIRSNSNSNISKICKISSISPSVANRLVTVYRQFRPDTFWLHSPDNPNQNWYLLRTGLAFLFVCIQDSFQTFQGQRIGWLTACFRSGSVSMDKILTQIDYPWIWMDRAFLNGDEEGWLNDGPFHWYAYQWRTCSRPSGSYGIVV